MTWSVPCDPGVVATILALTAAAALIARTGLSLRAYSTDHYVHRSIIGLIRLGGHRFLRTREDFLYNDTMTYPQLLHWALSFLPEARLDGVHRWLTPLAWSGATAGFLMFSAGLQSRATDGAEDPARALLVAGLLFVLAPYPYDVRSPRTRGLSGRGVGTLAGQLYLYAVLWHGIFGGLAALGVASGLMVFILLSSQFTLQFVLFSAPVLTVLTGDPVWLAPPVAGLAVFCLAAPGLARRYLAGQIRHKTFIARHQIRPLVLRLRESIWRDWVWDFWRPRRERLAYIYFNPILRVVAGLPAVTVCMAAWVGGAGLPLLSSFDGSDPHDWLGASVLASLALFLATSLRWTRFLGEPERYVEFALGPACLLAASLLGDRPLALGALLAVSAGLLLFERRVLGASFRRGTYLSPDDALRLDAALTALESASRGPLRLLSNDRQLARRFLSPDRKVFHGQNNSPWCGPFHFEEIHTEDMSIEPWALAPIIRTFNIDVLLLRRRNQPGEAQVLDDPQLQCELVVRVGPVELFKVSKRSPEARRNGAPPPTAAARAPGSG